jgi:hypothetical protein
MRGNPRAAARGTRCDGLIDHVVTPIERRAPLDAPLARTLDRPLWLGEFPTAGSSRSVPEILEAARLAGYAAALGWSAETGDRWSSGPALHAATRP